MWSNVPKIEVSWWLFNSELKFDGLAFFSKLSWNDLMSWSLCTDPVVSWRLKTFEWFWSSSLLPLESVVLLSVQVNLFQKLSFLNQLTHNMTRDCSLNSPKNTSSQHVVYKNCFFVFVLTFKTIFVHNMLWTCIFRGIQWTISRHIVG